MGKKQPAFKRGAGSGNGKRGPVKGFRALPSAAEVNAERERAARESLDAVIAGRIDHGLSLLADLAICVRTAREMAAAESIEQDTSKLLAHEREDPKKLSGAALRALANRRGISLSEMSGMSDEKLRTQVHMIVCRQYDDAEA